MGKIDWHCGYCDLAFRAYDGRCPKCDRPIRPINRFELNKAEQLAFNTLIKQII